MTARDVTRQGGFANIDYQKRMPPGKDSDDWLTILRSGMWRLYYQLSAEGRRRYYNELLPVLHQTKHEVMGDQDDDCYYLVYLGTKPSGQRRGYARKLIEHMAAKVRILISFLPAYPRPYTHSTYIVPMPRPSGIVL